MVELANSVASGPQQPTGSPGFFVSGESMPSTRTRRSTTVVVADVDGVAVDNLEHESRRGDGISRGGRWQELEGGRSYEECGDCC